MNAGFRGWVRQMLGGDDEADITDPTLEIEEPGEAPWAEGGSDQGRVRSNNEDSYLCDMDRALFVVADGMGGHVGGERASAIAIESLDSTLSCGRIAESQGNEELVLREAVASANDAVLDAAETEPALEGMGTTVVVAMLRDHTLHVANVGDSRAYLIRGVEAKQLSMDHSVPAALARQGEITWEEARVHPMRNQLTASLGLRREIEFAYTQAEVEPGDRVILCSDGLWDMLSDAEIGCVAADCDDPRMIIWELIRLANEAGGHDNVTVVAAVIGTGEEFRIAAAETEAVEHVGD